MSVAVDALLETARETAVRAGALVREQWTQPRHVTHKGFRDLLTDADLASQKLITDSILARFPDHGFLPEEIDSSLPTDGPVTWIIDPIDGTTNYSRQVPIFCIAIAAVSTAAMSQSAEEPASRQDSARGVLAGVIYDPMRDELFSAAPGQGCKLNGQPVQVSQVDKLSESVISLDWSHSRQRRQGTLDVLDRFAHRVHTVRAIGSAALGLAWLAAGRLDCYLNFNLKPWDVAAASLMIQEAGGRLTDVAGQPYHWAQRGNDCFASNGRIHQKFLRLLTAR